MVARAAVILAAGQGTRMRSPRPKVLHAVGGRTMLDRAIDAAEGAGCERVVVVCGPHAPAVGDAVRKRLGDDAVAIQAEQLGTGHAVLSAREALAGFEGDVVVTFADSPMIEAGTLTALFALRDGADIAVLGFEAADPGAYGRLVLGADGSLERIVEAKGAPPEVLALRTCNSGVKVADARLMFGLLDEVPRQESNGEYYLTDIVGLARGRGLKVAVSFVPEVAVLGVNSQAELAAAEAAFQATRRRELLDGGVTMPAPDTVHLSHDTVVEGGATVEPFVVFGPGVRVAGGAVIRAFSHLEGAHVEAGAIVGPYARLRPGARIGPDAHIGNFVEVKNVTVGEGAKANHLAYLGDGEVGAKANIGAGVIFCNYDGYDKHRTTVGEGAFVGSDVALVAPVSIGAGAYVGSGSVITKPVSPDALAVERSPQVERPGWAAAFHARKRAERAAKGKP